MKKSELLPTPTELLRISEPNFENQAAAVKKRLLTAAEKGTRKITMLRSEVSPDLQEALKSLSYHVYSDVSGGLVSIAW